MIDGASCKHVSKNELTPGGTIAAISAMRSSGIGPGPLGIADTNPIALAPASIAIHASSILAMQQILIRGFVVGFMIDAWTQSEPPRGSGWVRSLYWIGAYGVPPPYREVVLTVSKYGNSIIER